MGGLFVGINRYFSAEGEENRSLSLAYAASDAERVCNTIKRVSKTANISLINGEARRPSPTRNEILAQLQEAVSGESATEGANFVFYFAGHGCTVGAEWMLLPCDFDHRIAVWSGIGLAAVLEILRPRRGLKLVIADCCRANIEYRQSFARERWEGVGTLPLSEDVIVLSACSPGEFSFETAAMGTEGGGVFTQTLCEVLEAAARRKSQEPITIYDIYEEVREKTSITVSQFEEFERQTPSIVGGDAKDWAWYLP